MELITTRQLSKHIDINPKRFTKIKIMWDAEILLNDYGWQWIGSGAYGKVFRHPEKEFVLKVFEQGDESYKSFVRFCLRHPHRHLPRFSSRILHINKKFSAVLMEPLVPFRNQSMVNIIQSFVFSHDDEDPTTEMVVKRANWKKLIKTQPKLPDVLRALILWRFMTDCGSFDIHSGNLMWRNRVGGDLVVTDPFA